VGGGRGRRAVQTKGGNRESNGQNTHLIADPRAFFAKQFAASDKYVRMITKFALSQARAVQP
jgi:hypothetical protein